MPGIFCSMLGLLIVSPLEKCEKQHRIFFVILKN